MATEPNGWTRAEMHVMEELGRLSKEVSTVALWVGDLRTQIAALQTEMREKSQILGALWGLVGGTIASVFVAVVLRYVTK